MNKIVCDNKIPFLRGVLEPYAEVVYLPGVATDAQAVKDASALITRTRTICNRELLEGSSVKVIATATIGFDHIDTAWVEANGIEWANAPGCNSGSVQHYIEAVLCTLARRHSLRFEELTLGVVGVGNVGRKVAAAARAMGMRVLQCDPPRARREGPQHFVSLDTIIAEADIITLHVPLERAGEDATYHLFDADRLSQLRPDQYLINSSRGPVVDNVALKTALEENRIAGAVLDVWEGEPALDAELVNMLEISTPHIAGYSADGKANGTTAAVRKVAEVLGLPLTDWSVKDLPQPEMPLDFTLEAASLSTQEVVEKAILHTYPIEEDSNALRSNLADFERLRGDYWIRREPAAFCIHLKGGDGKARQALSDLGFSVESE